MTGLQLAPVRLNASQRRAVGLLTAVTAVGSLGLAAGGTAGGLLAVELTGNKAAAGLPIGLLVAGSALGAIAISAVNTRAGRATGLVVGYALGVIGAVAVIGAAVAQSFPAVLAASTVLGAGNVAVFLARYAAADLGPPSARARSLGVVLFGAAAGAVTSPVLLGPSDHVAAALGLPRFTGPYLVSVVAFAVAGALAATLRRSTTTATPRVVPGVLRSAAWSRRFGGALAVLAVANLVMVAMMAIAPVHLSGHGHDLDTVGLIVAAHVLCMFAPAPVTGWLTDRFGPRPVALLGAVMFVAAGWVGASADSHSAIAMTASLVLLGVGWNAGVVAGSAMLIASAPSDARTWAEGIGEVAMGTAAAIGGSAAGVVAASGGFAALAIAGACTAVLAIAVVGRLLRSSDGAPVA